MKVARCDDCGTIGNLREKDWTPYPPVGWSIMITYYDSTNPRKNSELWFCGECTDRMKED